MSKRKETQDRLSSDDSNPLGFMRGNQAGAGGRSEKAETSSNVNETSKSQKRVESGKEKRPTDRIRRTYSVARRTDEQLENLQERLIDILFHRIGPSAVKDVSKSSVLDTAVAFFNEFADHEDVEDFVASRFSRHS